MGLKNRPFLAPLVDCVQALEQSSAPVQNNVQPYVVLFLSFDIVNSTHYKATHKGRWTAPMREILEHMISSFVNDPMGDFLFWKTLGDEIVYTKKVRNTAKLQESLEAIHAKLNILNSRISEGVICDVESGKILGIKATAWIADISSSCDQTDNIYTEFQINDNRKQPEFIGSDIDAGFRLSYYSAKNQLLISYELAHVLANCGQMDEINLLTYRQLKGIWNGNPYPIFVYRGSQTPITDPICDYPPIMDDALLLSYETHLSPWPMAGKPHYLSFDHNTFAQINAENDLEPKMNRITHIIDENPTPYRALKPPYNAQT